MDKHFRVPRDKHSLLAQSLQTKLVSHGQADRARPQDNSILTHLSHKAAAAQVSRNINTVIMNCFNAITNALFSLLGHAHGPEDVRRGDEWQRSLRPRPHEGCPLQIEQVARNRYAHAYVHKIASVRLPCWNN